MIFIFGNQYFKLIDSSGLWDKILLIIFIDVLYTLFNIETL